MVTANNLSAHLLNYHDKYKKNLRLGQWFCNYHVPACDLPWPELYYQTDYNKCLDIITKYITDGIRQSTTDPYF